MSMSKGKDSKEDVSYSEVAYSPVSESSAALPKILVRPPQVKTYSFEQWAKLRNKPARHLGGMKAFLKDKSGFKYPLVQWDEIFKAY